MPEYESYDSAYFAKLVRVEDRHFWFRTRNQVIGALVKQMLRELPPGCSVLEVGCGTGNTLRVLEANCPGARVVGLDLFPEAIGIARSRTSCPLVVGDISHLPFSCGFDLIGCFDVLEHIEDDESVLRHLYSALAPGGALFLTVPAHRALWSYFDVVSHHCRRYELAELREKLVRARFRVEYLTPYMMSIYPLVWLRRRVAIRANQVQRESARRVHELVDAELRVSPFINEPLAALLALEARWVAIHRRLPLGTSLLAIARHDAEGIGRRGLSTDGG